MESASDDCKICKEKKYDMNSNCSAQIVGDPLPDISNTVSKNFIPSQAQILVCPNIILSLRQLTKQDIAK